MKEFDNITLHRADCMDIMAGYPDNYFDLAVVDPPYGIGADKSQNDSSTTGRESNGGEMESIQKKQTGIALSRLMRTSPRFTE